MAQECVARGHELHRPRRIAGSKRPVLEEFCGLEQAPTRTETEAVERGRHPTDAACIGV